MISEVKVRQRLADGSNLLLDGTVLSRDGDMYNVLVAGRRQAETFTQDQIVPKSGGLPIPKSTPGRYSLTNMMDSQLSIKRAMSK